MKLTVLHFTPYEPMIRAARISHDSLEKMDTKNNILGENDKKLLQTLIKQEHFSVLEHIVYTFEISDISRALLQELARHRLISMTVQSTRFTLKKHAKQNKIDFIEGVGLTEEDEKKIQELLEYIQKRLGEGASNDVIKYLIPEAVKTKLIMTVNARELSHIINLRIRSNALPEFQGLATFLLIAAHTVHPELWGMLIEKFNYPVQIKQTPPE